MIKKRKVYKLKNVDKVLTVISCSYSWYVAYPRIEQISHARNVKQTHFELPSLQSYAVLMILTNAAAKRDFYLIRHFGVKMSSAPRHTQHQDILGVKIVASSCPASSRSRQAVLLRLLAR